MARQERAIRTRAGLLAAAAVEFDLHGYLATTLEDVAERAGLTRGSTYYHFSSKSELASSLVLEQYDRWTSFVTNRQAEGYRGIEVVMFLAHDLAISFRDDVCSRAAMRLTKERAHIEAVLPTPFAGWIEAVRGLLHEARDLGQVANELDIDDAAWIIVANFFGIQEIGDQLEQRQNICLRLDSLWMYLLPGFGVTNAAALVSRIAEAA